MSGIGDEDLLAAIDANDLFKDVVEEEYDLDELEDDQLQSPEHNFDYRTQSAYAQERRMSAHDIQVNEMAEATRRAASVGGLVPSNDPPSQHQEDFNLEESEYRAQNQFVIDQINEEEDEDGSSNGESSLRLENQNNADEVKSPRINIHQLTETGENLRISTAKPSKTSL